MKRFHLLFVATLLGVAVSAPAQRNHEGRFGRHHRGTVEVVTASQQFREHRPARSRHVARRSFGRSHGRRGGYWTTRCDRVRVPGYWTWRSVPARFGWITRRCGDRYWGVVRQACRERVWVPPRYENRSRRVWVRR